jgi:diadenylate cyclase
MTDRPGDRVPAVSKDQDERRRAAMAALAPGTALRDGLERILRGNTGALIVLGYDQAVADICSGGFELDVEFSATRLRELAKMDGAIVLDGATHTIVRAAVQLVPDPGIPTEEAGTRHRTAQRVSRQTGHPVIAVSKSMQIIRGHPVARQPGPGHAGAVQAQAGRGVRGAVRAGDRGPGHRP